MKIIKLSLLKKKWIALKKNDSRLLENQAPIWESGCACIGCSPSRPRPVCSSFLPSGSLFSVPRPLGDRNDFLPSWFIGRPLICITLPTPQNSKDDVWFFSSPILSVGGTGDSIQGFMHTNKCLSLSYISNLPHPISETRSLCLRQPGTSCKAQLA